MTNDDSRPIIDDESYIDGIRYETWTDRKDGLAYVRADFSDINADFPTLAERPDSSADESASPAQFDSGSLYGASGLEVFTLSYPYYTGAEKVSPYERHFTPDWALDAFERHGYDVLLPGDDFEVGEDGEILTDGGSTPDPRYEVTVTIRARLPGLGERTYTFSAKISEESEADDFEDDAENVVPDEAEILDIETAVDRL